MLYPWCLEPVCTHGVGGGAHGSSVHRATYVTHNLNAHALPQLLYAEGRGVAPGVL
jgi:hypothetical protein